MKIFVSYSRRDAGDFANKIDESLKDHHDIFTDINNIELGDVWSNTIEKNISTCDIFIVIITFSSLRSSEVEKEVLQAQKENKKIIPCVYRSIRKDKIKWGVEKIQGIEFINEYQLVRELSSKIIEYEEHIPRDVTALHEKGRSLYSDSKFQEAIEYFDKVLEIDPNSTSALYNKGLALYKQGKYQEAIEYYDKRLRIDPNSTSALYNKGLALDYLGKYQEAIEYYDKVLKIDTNDVDVFNAKGSALFNQGKYEEAIEYYDKALVISPNYAVAQNNKKLALERLSE